MDKEETNIHSLRTNKMNIFLLSNDLFEIWGSSLLVAGLIRHNWGSLIAKGKIELDDSSSVDGWKKIPKQVQKTI